MTIKDEDGNAVPSAIVEVYRLQNVSETRSWSRKHQVYLNVREYRLHGDVTPQEAERVIRLVFQKTPERRLTDIQFSPDSRTCWVYWQSAT